MAKFLTILVSYIVLGAAVPTRKIIGGHEAADGAYPYQVSVLSLGSHSCGGSILNEKWILTAAHCIYGFLPEYMDVKSGTNHLFQGGTVTPVHRAIMHPKFNRSDLTFDVGLLELAKPLQMSAKVAPLELYREEVDGERPVILTGWGSVVYPNGRQSETLQEIELQTITNYECRFRYGSRTIEDAMICTYTKSGEGACHGDSGGPLVDKESGKQIGIVSFGKPCAVGMPDVFTRVSSYMSWIEETMSK